MIKRYIVTQTLNKPPLPFGNGEHTRKGNIHEGRTIKHEGDIHKKDIYSEGGTYLEGEHTLRGNIYGRGIHINTYTKTGNTQRENLYGKKLMWRGDIHGEGI